MGLVERFLRDDRGSAIAEYSLTFALFGFAAIVGMLGFQMQASTSLVNTRARMTCNSISLKPVSSASVDASGNITCK